MNLFGSLKELVTIVFRKDSQQITLEPNQATTYTASRIVQLPPQDAAGTLVSADSTQTLSNKSISGSSNTITNVSLTTGVTGILPTANGGTNQNSTATFPTSGVVVTEAATETLSNKTLDNTSTIAIKDTLFSVQDDGDATKKLAFQLSGVTTGNTRTLTVPDASTTILGTDATQVITNKDIDGGVAANTRRITVPGDTTTNINALTRKAGTLLYDTSLGVVKYDNGSTLTTIAAGSVASPTASGTVTSYFPTIQSAVKSVSSADYTVLTTDGYEDVLVSTANSNRTITLPAAASNTGRRLNIKKTDSGTGKVIVDGNASETVDGALTFSLYLQYEAIVIVCDGSNWSIVSAVGVDGTWTPTITGTNVSNGSVITASFTKYKNKVIVHGQVQVDNNGSAFQINLTWPTSLAVSSNGRVDGTAMHDIGSSILPMFIRTEEANSTTFGIVARGGVAGSGNRNIFIMSYDISA